MTAVSDLRAVAMVVSFEGGGNDEEEGETGSDEKEGGGWSK